MKIFKLNIQHTDQALTVTETANVIFNHASKGSTPAMVVVLGELKTAFAFGEIKSKRDLSDLTYDIEMNQDDYGFDYPILNCYIWAACEAFLSSHELLTIN